MTGNFPLWRSMLFVPANIERFIVNAHKREADAIILDLEDGVPFSEKPQARQNLQTSVDHVGRKGADVVIRINNQDGLRMADLEASVSSAIHAICIPKVSSAYQLQELSEIVDKLEQERKLPSGQTKFIALIETPGAMFHLEEIANSTDRLIAMTLGPEDFSAAIGMEPNAETLYYPNQQIVFAACSAGIMPLGFIGSIADYSDLEAFRKTIGRSKKLGLVGGFCIHPDQVKIMNQEFAPTTAEISDANNIIKIYNEAFNQGHGTAKYKGKMIDPPVASRAEHILAINKKIARKSI